MKLKEVMKEEIDNMDIDDLLFLYEQIRLLKRSRLSIKSKYTLEEILEKTSTSKSNWAEEVAKERLERG